MHWEYMHYYMCNQRNYLMLLLYRGLIINGVKLALGRAVQWWLESTGTPTDCVVIWLG